MARITVEQTALVDPRFELLGRLLESNRHEALGRMLLIWNACQERESYTLAAKFVSAVLGHPQGAAWLADECELAEWVDDATLRIKGTEGRIEWLAKKRAAARENGSRGGRKPISNQERTDVGSPPVSHRLQPATPPAPAPAPAPAQEDTPPAPPRGGDAPAKSKCPPEKSEAMAHHEAMGYTFSFVAWWGHYESNGWKVGKVAMRNWKASMAQAEAQGWFRPDEARQRAMVGKQVGPPPPDTRTPEQRKADEAQEEEGRLLVAAQRRADRLGVNPYLLGLARTVQEIEKLIADHGTRTAVGVV